MIHDGKRFNWILVRNHTNYIGTFGHPASAMAYVRKSTCYDERQWFSSQEGMLSSWASKPDEHDPDEYEVITAPHGLIWDEKTDKQIHPVMKAAS